jgi:hypothetical protein
VAATRVELVSLPQRVDVNLRRGDTWAQSFDYRQADGTTQVNLTGYHAELAITGVAAGTYTDTTPTGTPAIVLGGGSYNIAVTLTPAQTAGLAHGSREWSLSLTAPGGAVTTLLAGTMNSED